MKRAKTDREWLEEREKRQEEAHEAHSFLMGAKIVKYAVNRSRCHDWPGDGLDYFTIEAEDGTRYNIGHENEPGWGSEWCITKI